MPKCLECGFEAPRLQWTHFRYKCTGRFKNGREYQSEYPGAKLVDDDLAKRTAITLANLVAKYGNEEGERRWESYRNKQAKTNSYEYKRDKYGWTQEDFDAYNKSRSVTLENLIARHGEEEGTARWQEYCQRQAYTNTLAYFVDKYGETQGKSRYEQICNQKSHTVENVQRVHGCSKQEALKILSERSHRLEHTSKIEKQIIKDIENELGMLDHTVFSKQYCVWGNNRANFYDIVHNRRAIEINGDYWHCNPVKYPDNYLHPHIQMLAKEIWKKDEAKISLLEKKRNIPVLVVWEGEYLENPEQTVRRCIDWLQEKQ